jgi:hypothetical protein
VQLIETKIACVCAREEERREGGEELSITTADYGQPTPLLVQSIVSVWLFRGGNSTPLCTR